MLSCHSVVNVVVNMNVCISCMLRYIDYLAPLDSASYFGQQNAAKLITLRQIVDPLCVLCTNASRFLFPAPLSKAN